MRKRVTFWLFYGVMLQRLLVWVGIYKTQQKEFTPGTTSAWSYY